MAERYNIRTEERSRFFGGSYYVATAYDRKKGVTVATVSDDDHQTARHKLLDKITEYEANGFKRS
ncbi:MAG: hypothetical protein AABX77_00285 [Nanoarchaeota archaeon]